MKTKKTMLIVIVIALIIIAGLLLFYSLGRKSETDGKDKKTVAILTMGNFPLLDMISEELQETLEASTDPAIGTRVFNANFQQELLRKSSREMATGDYDVLVTLSTPATQVAVSDNKGQKPLVFAFVSTPSEIGLTETTPLPNVTGFIDLVPVRENLKLIESVLGNNAAIGYIVNDGEGSAKNTYGMMAEEVKGTGLQLKKIPIGSQSDLRAAIVPVIKQVDCLFFGPDSQASGAADLIVQIALEHNKPVFCTDMISVERGVVGCVAPDYRGMGRRTAEYVKRIISGTPVNELSVVNFDEYVTYLNMKSVDRLKLNIPKTIIDKSVHVSAD